MNIKAGQNKNVRVIAIASGKGGVGKTNISINLAIALADTGKEVTLFDADLGLANVDVLLGLHPLRNLSHVIKQECSLQDILITGPNDIKVIPAASGVKMMSQLTDIQHAALIHAFDELVARTDVLIIDTSAGLFNSVLSFCAASQEVVVVVCNEPASIADAYALIKVLHRDHEVSRFRVLINMVDEREDGRALFRRLVQVCDTYLDVVLDLMGMIPRDMKIVKAVQRQRPLLQCYPSSPAALEFKKLAQVVDKWPREMRANGKLEFFLERIIDSQVMEQGGGRI
ncbi:MAG: flagellar biosynthesis protein FlhG [Planctomycetota bacterium]|jgi:flagellar biosynthesis protein FlhG